MTIAKNVFGVIGARTYLPEGPYGAAGTFPLPSFADGTVMEGELGAEYEFVRIAVATSFTLNQGDVLVWDNSGLAVQSQTGSGVHPFGASVGTAFFGGRVGDQASQASPGNVWSYTFATPGVYGMWAQRAGKSLLNCATINAQTKPLSTTAVNGQVNAPATPLSGSMGINSAFTAPLSGTFTANTTSGSTVLTTITGNALKFVNKGMTLSGTGIATGAVVTDIGPGTITMSLAATATNSAQTITATKGSSYATTTSGSPNLTNVTSIDGFYPNGTIAGTGIPASTTIVAIWGNAAPYTIQMSGTATATANNIALTASIYTEAFLLWPFIGSQN
jgi:hypothetical protein